LKLLHADATEGQLVGFTRFVLCLWVAHYLTHSFEEIAMLPLAAISPTGIIGLLPVDLLAGLLDESVLFGLRVLILGLCLAGLSTPLFPVIGLPLCAAITFELSFVRSFGHAGHSEVPLLLITVLLAVFALLEAWHERARPGRRARTTDGPRRSFCRRSCSARRTRSSGSCG
jgi:hypothetical protein